MFKDLKKYLFISSLLLILILCLGVISASEDIDNQMGNADSDLIASSDISVEKLNENSGIDEDFQTSIGDENDQLSVDDDEDYQINCENEETISKESQGEVLSSSPKTFTDLNNVINGNNNSEIYLDSDYTYDPSCDSNFKDGIKINRKVTIYGNGFTLSGNNTARIFYVYHTFNEVFIHNIVFENAYGKYGGGALSGGTAVNCTFINNSVSASSSSSRDGGAMIGGSAINCTFINNSAEYGGAIESTGGDVINCTFINNRATDGSAIYSPYSETSVINCTFINNTSTYSGGVLVGGSVFNSTFINNYNIMCGASAFNCTFINNTRSIIESNLFNCSLINNSGGYRSAILEDSSAFNCIFINNTAQETDSAVVNNSLVSNSLFENNSARYGGAMTGGRAINCRFINNSADYGGAVFNASVSNDCSFADNHASYDGDDTYNVTLFVTGKSFTELKSLIESNSEVYLDSNYTFDASDYLLKDGINITHPIVIYGNGFALDASYFACIFNVNSSDVIFKDVMFINSYVKSASSYAGVYSGNGVAISGNSTAINCTFLENHIRFTGFVIACVNAENCTFINNSADYGGVMGGGTAINCSFTNNSGGSSFSVMNNVAAFNCSFLNNSGGYGAVMRGGYAINCSFINNLVTNDYQQLGGVVYSALVSNSYFENNSAILGGALSGGRAINCSFVNNSADYGGAVYNASVSNDCIFIDNHANYEGDDTYNVTFFETGKSFTELKSLIDANSEIYLDSNYIFSPSDYLLIGGINIDHSIIIYGNGFTLDASNLARFFNINADNVIFNNITFANSLIERSNNEPVGSVINGICTVINSSFINNSIGPFSYSSILDGASAIGCAFNDNIILWESRAIFNGSAVNCTFENNTVDSYGALVMNGSAVGCSFINNSAKSFGALVMNGSTVNCSFINNTADIMRVGSAVNCSFINNNGQENGRAVYDIAAVGCSFINNSGGAMSGGSAVNCIFINNRGEDNSYGYKYGVAMCVGSAVNCTFISNYASGEGGATYDVDAVNCTFINNSASLGGAMCGGSAVNCTFINNSAGSGGAIAHQYDISNGYVVKNSIFIGNTANYGGALSLSSSAGALNCSFINNSANYGGAVYSGKIFKCTFKGNLATDAGNDYYGTQIVKIDTKITSSAVSTVYIINKYLTVTLKDVDGNPISGVKVSINLSGVKTLTTDKNGQVKFNIAKLVPKTYNAKISFAGNGDYAASSNYVKVTVKKATPKLTASKKTFKLKVKTKKYTVTLKNHKKTVLKKYKLTLKVKGKTFTAKTNSKGKATFKITNLKKKGTFNAVVKFAGNKYYKKISKTVKITVK